MNIVELLDWIVANGTEIIAIVGGIVTVATAIARLTPTQKDNKFIEKWVRRPCEWISNVGLPNLVKTRKGIKRS